MLEFLRAIFSSAVSGAAIPGPQTLARLRELRGRPLPPELAVAPPRPDVWGERGYLSQPRYQSQYKPLLLHGFATWGFVYHYSGSSDPDGYDFEASYAWIDAMGGIQLQHLRGGYDALHAAYSRGQGDILLDMDAELNEDVELVILHDLITGEHIPYRALRTTPEPERPKPPPDPLFLGDWVDHIKDGQYIHPYPPGRDPRALSGTFRLEWDTARKTRSARLVRPVGRKHELLCTVERAGSSNREWTLTRSGESAASLRALHHPMPGATASFRFEDAHGNTVGSVTERAGRVRLAASIVNRSFYTGSGDSKERRVLLEEMRDVLTLERTDRKDRDTLVLHRPTLRSVFELLLLALVVIRHPPRQRKKD